MKPVLLRAFLLFLIFAGVGHYALLQALPSIMFLGAYRTLENRGVMPNTFHLSNRITPETQRIVRTSPDLAYSVCTLNLAQGPVRLSLADWRDYASLSVFGADTNVLYAAIKGEQPTDIVVAQDGQSVTAKGTVVYAKTDKALAVIRRLAPTADAYNAVSEIADGDICEPLGE